MEIEFPRPMLSLTYIEALLGGDQPLPCEDCGIRDDSVKYSTYYEAWLCDADWMAREA